MKRGLFLLLTLGFLSIAFGQSQNDAEWERERDAINAVNEERERWQEDFYYKQMMEEEQRRRAEIERIVMEAAAARARQSAYSNQASGGNRTTSRSKRRSSSSQTRQQANKAQRAAEHRAWLEERNASISAAAARAEEERLRREERERQEQQKRYNEALVKEYKRSEAQYMRMHSEVNYKATEGFTQMMNTQPTGTERIRSEYVPSNTSQSKPSIASIVGTSRANSLIRLTGNEHSSLDSDYDKAMTRYFMENQIGPLPKVEIPGLWKEMTSHLDSGQIAVVQYLMSEYNGEQMPTIIGVNDHGEYLLESSNGSVFCKVSPNGSLQILHLEEHFWEDNNIIEKIKDGGLIPYLSESFKFKYNKGGTLGLEDLKEFEIEKLKKLLPQIKAEIKMSMFDNSSKLSWKGYAIRPESNVFPGVKVTGFGGLEAAFTAGPKASVHGDISVNASDLVSGLASASATALEIDGSSVVGSVIRVGGRCFISTASIGGEASVGIMAKKTSKKNSSTENSSEGKGKKVSSVARATGEILPGLNLGISIGGIGFRDITPKRTVEQME